MAHAKCNALDPTSQRIHFLCTVAQEAQRMEAEACAAVRDSLASTDSQEDWCRVKTQMLWAHKTRLAEQARASATTQDDREAQVRAHEHSEKRLRHENFFATSSTLSSTATNLTSALSRG